MAWKIQSFKSEQFEKTKNDMVREINLNADKTPFDCELYHISKICQILYKSSTNRTEEKLWLIYLDIYSISSRSLGAIYFVTFMYDYTRHIEVLMLKDRSKIVCAFKKLHVPN